MSSSKKFEVTLGGLVLLLTIACSRNPAPSPKTEASPTSEGPFKIFVFTKTAGFRHDSISAGVESLKQLATDGRYEVESGETLPTDLSPFKVLVFLNTTGDAVDASHQPPIEAFVRGGGGFVGIHSATDTEYDWPFYGGLVGAYFADHPAIQKASIRVDDSKHPSTQGLPTTWERTDEWYNFRANPRGKVHVLLSLDEKSYQGGKMGADHPIAWCHTVERGRSFYTAGGHTIESYSEPLFRTHLVGGITWAAGVSGTEADCAP